MDNHSAGEQTFEAGGIDCGILNELLETGCDEARGCEEDGSDLLVVGHGCDTGVELELT